MTPPAAADQDWDVIVVGTGMGGAVCGYELARRGRRVLFVERGLSRLGGPLIDGEADASPERRRLRSGLWPHPFVRHWPGDLESVAYHPLGCGAGGGTSIYGMVLERFFREDFAPRRHHPGAETSTLPEAWPISYAELTPHYRAAEALFRVRGTGDPLRPAEDDALQPPQPATTKELYWTEHLRARGLHPYRTHHACERVAGCDGCRGRVCDRACRNDAWRMCLAPALEAHGATLLAECEVERIATQARRAVAVHARSGGQALVLRGRALVIAAGAHQTPRLLLASAGGVFPNGLANGSDQVGRNLMFHVSDAFALTAPGANVEPTMGHAISFNDWYARPGEKLGNVMFQSHAVEGDLATLLRSRGIACEPSTVLLATILEDLPYADNRVLPARASEDEVVRFRYVRSPELTARSERFRARLSEDLGACLRRISDEDNLNWAHACGTCRMGDDPRQSVVDADGRCHDVDNLYIVDASWFPSAGGINPGLTIAANALRVAERIADRG